MQLEERSNSKLVAVNEESRFDEKEKDVPGEMTTEKKKSFMLRQFLELFYNTESTKVNMWISTSERVWELAEVEKSFT